MGHRAFAIAAALVALGVAGEAAAKSPPFPWKAGDPAPTVDGVTLGDTEARARQVLGPPATAGKMSTDDLLDYTSGLQIIENPGDGVSVIRLRTRAAGAIGGVAVGDDAAAVVARWGDPDSTAPGVALYNAGVWTVELRATGGKVTDILLGWNPTKWPDEPPNATAKVYRPN